MGSEASEGRPHIPDEIVAEWPAPPEVPSYRWQAWPLEHREAWLIDHTFEEVGERWVPRSGAGETTTTRRVLEAVNLGAATSATAAVLFGASETDAEAERNRPWSIGVVMVLILLTALAFGAFVIGLFDGDDTVPTPAGSATTGAEPPPSSTNPPGTAGTEASDEADEDTTSSSVASPDPILGAWLQVDGTGRAEFRDDGTYAYSDADGRREGRYRLISAGGDLQLFWLDPNDPSGRTHNMVSDVFHDADRLTLVTGGTEITFTRAG